MAIVTDVKSVAETVREQFDTGARAVIRARRAMQDSVDTAAYEVKRRPLFAVAASAALAGVIGCAIGFAFGKCRRT